MGHSTADHAPSRLRRQVEAQQLVVVLRDLLGRRTVPELLGQPVDLVVEDVGETLEEEERQQVVLELRRVFLATDRASGVPQHLLHGLGGRSVRLAPSGPPPGHVRRRLDFIDGRLSVVDARLGGKPAMAVRAAL